jgi:hypothetical protein
MRLADLFENSLAPVDVAALKQQLAAKQARFERLGGISYQYADLMMPDDYEAQQLHREIDSLSRKIQAAGG